MKFEEIVNRYTNLTYKIAIDMTSSPEDSQDLEQPRGTFLNWLKNFN